MFLRLVGFDCVANGIVALYCASKFNRHKAYWQGLVGGHRKKKDDSKRVRIEEEGNAKEKSTSRVCIERLSYV